ncbi:MAG: DUF3179 domain-containing protein [Gemmatimonadota bacterium]
MRCPDTMSSLPRWTRSRGRGSRARSAKARVAALATLCLALASRSSGGSGELAAQEIDRNVPQPDTTRHSVPLQGIVFDTFLPTGKAVPLTEASPALIERLRDAIPPLHHPRYESAHDAFWLRDGDMVIGYASGEKAWAFPVRILNFHEIVNDTLAGRPVLVSYCPLCASGIVFDRRVGADTLSFGNTSALYESDMVMVDYQTGSYWWQVAGEAIVGPRTGARLDLLPSATMRWEEWRKLHPGSRVLSHDTGYRRSYAYDPFVGYAERLDRGGFAFPVSGAARDDRLPASARVLAVELGGESRAYPLGPSLPRVVMDRLGGEPIVIFTAEDGTSAMAYRAALRDRELRFAVGDSAIVDRSGSRWNLAGEAIGGTLRGSRLTPVPAMTAYWFAVVASDPGIRVYDRAARRR